MWKNRSFALPIWVCVTVAGALAAATSAYVSAVISRTSPFLRDFDVKSPPPGAAPLWMFHVANQLWLFPVGILAVIVGIIGVIWCLRR